MGLNDVSGVFSRFFIVGFFLPSFFALVSLKLVLSEDWIPAAVEPDRSNSFLVLGAVALIIGLTLLGIRVPLIRSFSGYPLVHQSERLLYRPVRGIGARLLARQRKEFEQLETETLAADDETSAEITARRRAEWRLDSRFPTSQWAEILPTTLGNSIRAWEDHARIRWSLETICVWPRIEALLSEQESKLHADAETDFAFFFNLTIVSVATGAVMVLNGVVAHPHPASLAWIYLVPFIVAATTHRASIGAARRWGSCVRGSIDLHRAELYDRLGVRRPTTNSEIDQIGVAVNRMLLYGERLPDGLLAGPPGHTSSHDQISQPRG